ncbi:terminase small subunit [Buttiauxella agrestis]|uniref:terminase small subunit n=1 Tax=Buttiauxella agrestis TaxID=82977 RepID=UPI0039E9C8FA
MDNNATQAAIRAGYSKNNADKIGSELLGKTRVAQEIARQRIRNLNPSKSIGKTANCDA